MKLVKAFSFALNGFKICLSSEINFRIHVVAAVVAAAAGIWLHISKTEWMAVLFCTALVLVTEMLNTAVEKLCDIVHKDFHPLVKQVKDISAAAVLVAALVSIACGGLIFIPKFFML